MRYYFAYDQVGSLRAMIDGNGTVVKTVTYDSFGNVLEDSNEALAVPFGFAGGLYDADTGLVRFGFRDYDAEVARWTAKDRIGFAGGDSDLYGYVQSDPLDKIDDLGLYVVPFVGEVGPRGINYYDPYYQPPQPWSPPKGPFGPKCGPEGSNLATWIPDSIPDACEKHDKCYDECAKACEDYSCKQRCDYKLMWDSIIYGTATYFGGKDAYDAAKEKYGCPKPD